LYARHIAGRFNFAVTNGFMYLLSLASFAFGLWVCYRRGGRRFTFHTAVLSCAASAAIAWGVYHRRHARPLVIDNILNLADQNVELKALVAGRSTADIVNTIMAVNTFLALTAIGFVMGAICLVSVRPAPADLTPSDLKERARVIRVALMLVSAILVLYVILSRMLLQWPLSLLVEEQALALQKISTAVITYWSVAATIGLLAIFTPAIVSYQLDVDVYRAKPAGQAQTASEDKAGDGLDFAPRTIVSAAIALLAPLLASPIADALKSIIGALPTK